MKKQRLKKKEMILCEFCSKLFRTEAVMAGFKKAWANKDYAAIVNIGERLPGSILQEDSTLLMDYDNSLMRAGEWHRQETLL